MHIARNTILFLVFLLFCIYMLNIRKDYRDESIFPDRLGIHEIVSISPKDESSEDLKFLKYELAGKRVVILGESLHYDGSAFEAKTKLVKFLHRELGFNILAFEAGEYDIWRMNRLDSIDPRQGLWNFWSESDQMQELWKYLRDNKMEIAGFDIQPSGAYHDTIRRDSLFNYLNSFGINAPKRWPDFYGIAGRFRRYLYKNSMPEDKLDAIFNDMDEIVLFLQSISNDSKYDPYLSFVSGLRKWWECAYTYDTGEPYRFHVRDSLMAKNIIALSEIQGNENDKIIIWMANMHAFNDNTPFMLPFTNAGERLKVHFGDSLYTMLFTSYCGVTGSEKYTYSHARRYSLEWGLHKKKHPYLYVSGFSEKDTALYYSKVNQGQFYQVSLPSIADGILFIDTMRGISYNNLKNTDR